MSGERGVVYDANDPCLDTGAGPYRPGESAPMGFQLLVMDLDAKEDGDGWSNIRHQAVWSYPAGRGDKRLRENWGRLVLLPPGAEGGVDTPDRPVAPEGGATLQD